MLSFTSSQKTGIFLLALIILGFTGGRWVWMKMIHKPQVPNLPADLSLEARESGKEISPIQINLADSAGWASLPGIGAVLSKRIIAFRNSRGGFQSPDDLKKVYGLKSEVFEEIQPYLLADSALSPSNYATNYGGKRQAKARIFPIEINKADSAEWASMPGIGPVLSARIVRFRNAKGGFTSKEDLKKVYGLKPEVYHALAPYLIFEENEELSEADSETSSPARPGVLDLNVADSAQLVTLPGIGKTLAPRIVNFRKALGFFAETDQLILVYGMSEENFQRAKPYLQVGDISGYPRTDLNQATEKDLNRYPFLTRKVSANILKKRDQTGRFSDWSDLEDISGLKKEILRQMQFYFRIN